MQTPWLPLPSTTVKSACAWLLAIGGAGALAWPALAQSARVVITPEAGYTIAWDGNNGGYSNPDPGAGPSENEALASKGTVAFGSSEVGLNIHFIVNVNDGLYGNSSSWIPDFLGNPSAEPPVPPDPDPSIGLNFGRTVAVTSIAWGRDNGDTTEPGCGGTCGDRAVGVYTLQITRLSNPDATTAETGNAATGWVTIGTVEYTAGTDNVDFSAYLRHRFDVAQGGSAIQATGIRIKVSSNQMDIDEIEINPAPDPIPPITNFIVITPAAPYTISWDRNDGSFQSDSAPAPAPVNRGLASKGTVAFGSSEFGAGVHLIANVNDGLYGNSHSWIANFAASPPDPNPFIGLSFGALIELQNVAWSRDNGDATEAACGGTCMDRTLGVYTLQVTRVANPGVGTTETGDASTGWVDLGTINYKSAGEPFTPYLRHRFDLGTATGVPVQATGIRIKVPNPNIAIDEIEINVNVGQELGLVVITQEAGYSIAWDGNDGEFYSPVAGARSPNNDSLVANGGSAFGSSELGFGIHFITKINDGFYGNSSSWISLNGLGGSEDPDPYVGVKFGKTIAISSIAWGRDNGDTTEGGCGGTCLDRWQGVNTLQVTRVANPGTDTVETGDAATGWVTIGTVEYTGAAAPSFNPSRRHRFDVALNGQPIQATALRIKVGSGNTAIDELEVNPVGEVVEPPLTDLLVINSSAGYEITWDGNDGVHYSAAAGAPAPDNLARPAHGATAFGSSEADFGVHFIPNINDGLYGNSHSWIAKFTDPADPDPFIGVSFGQLIGVRTVAWGRDNGDTTEGGCANGTCTDRALGTYTLQITRVASPGVGTAETGDPATGWATVGTLEYKAAYATMFNPPLRHQYGLSAGGVPVAATGLRIKVSSNQIAIDELEVNPVVDLDQNLVVVTPEAGYAITWDGNNGDYYNPAPGGAVPNNAALASNGATAFGSSEVEAEGRLISKVNDGKYGDKQGWTANVADGADADPYVGIRFGKSVAIRDVAFGRDNGDDTEQTPAGPHTGRALGTYTLQVTTVADPGVDTQETGDPTSGWANVGSLAYRGAGSAGFRHYLRHSYGLSFEGQPVNATGIRIRVPSSSDAANQIVIDEIEVNTEVPIPQAVPVLAIERSGAQLKISWTGGGALQSAPAVTGTYTDVPGGGTSPQTISPTGAQQYYRVRR